MKKLLLLATALLTLSTVHAELILHESFNRELGQLTAGKRINCNDSTKWWSYAGWTGNANEPTDPIMVTEGSLSYPGYAATATGNKVQLQQVNGTSDVRYFREHKEDNYEGSVYAAAIVNVESATSTVDYFFGLSNGYTTCSRIYAKAESPGFQLAIAKGAELKTDLQYTQTLKYNTDYLVVLEYVIREGSKNDSLNLYVNPTKDRQVPTLVCNMKLANEKNDVASIAGVYLRQKTNGPKVAVDEIKVATAWEDLFIGGNTPVEEPAEITVNPASFEQLQGYVGETYTQTFTVNGKNLKEDITLTSNNAEVTLDKYTISKDAATDVVVTMTIAPKTEDYGSYQITLTSGEATATVTQLYWNKNIRMAATIAELNTLAATATDAPVYIKYTGEAVVTYKYNQSGDKLYLQDATAGVFINDSYWGDEIKRGDKVTNCIVYADAQMSVGGIMYVGTERGIEVLSHDNEVAPKVVTLAELQANPADYLCQLVKVEGVTFANTDAFASGDQIKQGENTATVNLIAGNDLIGTIKPNKADITAISSTTTGKVLRIRDKQDVVAVSTAIDNIATGAEIEIYTISGMRVSELQPGVNIIRQGDKTYKVVR